MGCFGPCHSSTRIVSPFLCLHRDISVHSEQQQLFRMEQGLERANTSRKIVTERIYAQGTEREEKWNFNEGEECWYTDPYLALSILAPVL